MLTLEAVGEHNRSFSVVKPEDFLREQRVDVETALFG